MFGEALRLLRTRQGLTQIAASKREGSPECRTLSMWENENKIPSLMLLRSYLVSLGLDFSDLQLALHQVEGTAPKILQDEIQRLDRRLGELERHLGLVEEPEDAGDDRDEG